MSCHGEIYETVRTRREYSSGPASGSLNSKAQPRVRGIGNIIFQEGENKNDRNLVEFIFSAEAHFGSS